MAAAQNHIYSPFPIIEKTPKQKHNLGSFFVSKNTSKRCIVSSSIMSPSSSHDTTRKRLFSDHDNGQNMVGIAHFQPLYDQNQCLDIDRTDKIFGRNLVGNFDQAAPVSRAPAASLPLSRVWREIQGSDNWENLLDPLSPILQQEITRYGNLLSASYKGFDLNPNSKRYLNCKYGKKNLLKESGIHDPDGYQVTKYIYATPDININPIQTEPNRARWIGFVAVSSDDSVKRLGRRDIVVTFRGTVTNPEWLANLMSSLTPARLDPHNPRPDVKVESGFLSLYTSSENEGKFGLESCREQLLSEISRLIDKHQGEEISITLTGHSMGSSLAQLLAYDIAELDLNRRRTQKTIPVTVFSFAGPRVGNLGFKNRCEELGVKVLRITNKNDPITKLPGFLFNENFRSFGDGSYELPWSCSCYTHVGVELTLDFFDVQNISCVHDLETYIDLVNRPRCSNFRRRALDLRKVVTNAAYVLSSVSNHMLSYSIF